MAIGTVTSDSISEIQAAMAISQAVEISESVTATVEIAAAVAGKRGAVASCFFKSTGAGNSIQFVYGASPTAIGGALEINDGEEVSIDASELLPYQAPEGESLSVVVTIAAGGVDGHVLPVYNKVRGVYS